MVGGGGGGEEQRTTNNDQEMSNLAVRLKDVESLSSSDLISLI